MGLQGKLADGTVHLVSELHGSGWDLQGFYNLTGVSKSGTSTGQEILRDISVALEFNNNSFKLIIDNETEIKYITLIDMYIWIILSKFNKIYCKLSFALCWVMRLG